MARKTRAVAPARAALLFTATCACALPIGTANAAPPTDHPARLSDARAVDGRTLPDRGPTFRRMDLLSRRQVAITLPADATVIRYEFRTRSIDAPEYGSWARRSKPVLKVPVNLPVGTWIQLRALHHTGYSFISTGLVQVTQSAQGRGDVTGQCALPTVRAIIFHTTMRAAVSLRPVPANNCVRYRIANIEGQYDAWQFAAIGTRRLTTGTMYEAVPGAVQLRARGVATTVTVMFPGTGPI